MAERFALETRSVADDFGEGRFRMLVGEARQRTQRLELRRRRDPAREPRAAAEAPAFEGAGDVGAPEQQRGDRREELIRALVPAIDQAAKTRELLRRHTARRHEGSRERDEQRRLEALALEAGEYCGAPRETLDRSPRRVQDRPDPAAHREGEAALERERKHQGHRPRAREDPERETSERERSRGGGEDGQRAGEGARGHAGPGLQRAAGGGRGTEVVRRAGGLFVSA